MNKQIEALKMAIEVLSQDEGWFDPRKAIEACKEALAEAEKQEPAFNEEKFNEIAYAYRSCPPNEVSLVSKKYQDLVNYVLSISHPATWQSLSDNEIEYLECLKAPPVHPDFIDDDSWHDFARAIEQALKEKNHG